MWFWRDRGFGDGGNGGLGSGRVQQLVISRLLVDIFRLRRPRLIRIIFS